MAQKIYDLIVYQKLTSPYTRYINPYSGLIWDVAAGALAAAPTYGNTDVQHTADNTYIGGTPVKIPPTLPPGDYDMLLYDSAAITTADVVVLGKRIAWDNNAAGTNGHLVGLPLSL